MDTINVSIEDTFHRLKAKANVSAVYLLTHEGQQLMSSVKPGRGVDKYALIINNLVEVVKQELKIADENAAETLNFMRFRSSAKEILIVPDTKYILAVIHTPTNKDNNNMNISSGTTPQSAF